MIIFGSRSEDSTMAVAVTNIVPQTAVSGVDADRARLGDLEVFRREF